jgi:hypothetical protein
MQVKRDESPNGSEAAKGSLKVNIAPFRHCYCLQLTLPRCQIMETNQN